MADVYRVPAHVREAVAGLGYPYPMDGMSEAIERWDSLFRASGSFWDFEDKSNGVARKMHRRTVRPAARVADEWASLLMDEATTVSCEDAECNEWLQGYLERSGFWFAAQELVARSFALGTGAWHLWFDTERADMRVRRSFARCVLPLSWDDDGVTECAFASQATVRGKRYDQLQMHVVCDDAYRILTLIWDEKGKPVSMDGVLPEFDTGCPHPTFAIVRPAVPNMVCDFSPYGASVYARAVDALEAVDLCYDAAMNEVDLAKLRIFLADSLIEYGNGKQPLPFGADNTVFRKVVSDGDLVSTFAPAMRTGQQVEAYRLALQTMGDLCGFGLTYFDVDKSGGMKTATEVSSDNAALMRNVRKHENLLSGAVSRICRALVACAVHTGRALGEPGAISVRFDDSIVQDTAAEKAQDMSELNVTMNPWEYRVKWYGEDEATARANVPEQREPGLEL